MQRNLLREIRTFFFTTRPCRPLFFNSNKQQRNVKRTMWSNRKFSIIASLWSLLSQSPQPPRIHRMCWVPQRSLFSYPSPRQLRDVVKLPLLERQDTATIESIWQTHFGDKPGIVASVWEEALYTPFLSNISACPMFIAPIITSTGFYVLFTQFQKPNSLLYTPLEAYKAQSIEAIPYFVVTLFTELLMRRGIVLLRGDILSPQISREVAKSLFEYTIRFYTEAHLFEWVKTFNLNSAEFQFDEFQYRCSHCFPRTVLASS